MVKAIDDLPGKKTKAERLVKTTIQTIYTSYPHDGAKPQSSSG